MKKLFSVVLPIYNNEKNLEVTIPYIVNKSRSFKGYDVEIIMVNDGSKDRSYEIMQKLQKEYPDIITIANLERNFGQGACTECGMSLAKGDAIGVISADLQDPFELFEDMLKYHEEGYKFVYGIRENREDKKVYAFIAQFVHKFMHTFIVKDWPVGGCDFYLADKSVVNNFVSLYKIRSASSLATFLYLTASRKELYYTRKNRELGKSGYSLKRKFQCFKEWVYYNSDFPIKVLGCVSGIWIVLLFLAWIIVALLGLDVGNLKMLFFAVTSALVLFGLWSIGQYVWILVEMGKKLPRYIISEVIYRSQEFTKK